jgi:hypothetical protein
MLTAESRKEVQMPFPWEVIASSAGAAAVTLLGVAAGAVLSSRGQRRHWSRDREIEACKSVLVESTRCQLALLRNWRRDEEVDWTAWNEALALIWLVGTPKVITAAYHMDEVFWQRGESTDEQAWRSARDEMETARLEFINAVRAGVLRSPEQLHQRLVARPPLPGARQPAPE